MTCSTVSVPLVPWLVRASGWDIVVGVGVQGPESELERVGLPKSLGQAGAGVLAPEGTPHLGPGPED